MQFIDEAKIFIKSGDGGKGCTSFRREAHVARGGPDGGNGGRGGSVTLEAVAGLNTLIDFRYTQHFKAPRGGAGRGSQCDGKYGEHMIVKLPVGTQVFDEDDDLLICDFTEVGQSFTLAKGGDGGLGNMNFKSSTNQAPRKATPGYAGEELWVWLKLKLLSDAGLAGLPNAGKSTFVNQVTRAKPKIADYPFTTLKPQLGVAYVDEKEFVIADIPGLIAGAHEGAGLGIRFLKHIERCGVVLHLVDATEDDIVGNYHTICGELSKYSDLLAQKKQIVCLNKCDALLPEMIEEKKAELEEASGGKVHAISAFAGMGVELVLRELLAEVEAFRALEVEQAE
jgi:GTP-binding protein